MVVVESRGAEDKVWLDFVKWMGRELAINYMYHAHVTPYALREQSSSW